MILKEKEPSKLLKKLNATESLTQRDSILKSVNKILDRGKRGTSNVQPTTYHHNSSFRVRALQVCVLCNLRMYVFI